MEVCCENAQACQPYVEHFHNRMPCNELCESARELHGFKVTELRKGAGGKQALSCDRKKADQRNKNMMPLNLAVHGTVNMIRKIGGSSEVRRHLQDLGFVAGGKATVVTALGGNLIVKIKDTRIAISEEMACKIMI